MVIGKPQTVIIMARIAFKSSYQYGTDSETLECYANNDDEIVLYIDGGEGFRASICLDIETSIQFSKHLRKQIAVAKSNIDGNGRS